MIKEVWVIMRLLSEMESLYLEQKPEATLGI